MALGEPARRRLLFLLRHLRRRAVEKPDRLGHPAPCGSVGAALIKGARPLQRLVEGLAAVPADPQACAFPDMRVEMRLHRSDLTGAPCQNGWSWPAMPFAMR